MIITQSIYTQLLLLPEVPPETGGLLGSHRGIIDTICIDISHTITEQAMYIPNIQYLNQQLTNWHNSATNWEGLFHSHLANSPELSQDDKLYIQTIMQAMPPHINKLYFPIILPGKKMTSFQAIRQPGNYVSIVKDNIKIVKNGGNDHDKQHQNINCN